MRLHHRVFTFAAMLLMAGSVSAAQTTLPAPPPLLTASLAGVDSFHHYCAPCHGPSGRGDGPVGPALNVRPSDLGQLSAQNGGVFPRARVRAILTGTTAVTAHGTSEMPVWGPLLRAFESEARARVRMENLVEFVESLQPMPAR